jgi:hypothetical protein
MGGTRPNRGSRTSTLAPVSGSWGGRDGFALWVSRIPRRSRFPEEVERRATRWYLRRPPCARQHGTVTRMQRCILRKEGCKNVCAIFCGRSPFAFRGVAVADSGKRVAGAGSVWFKEASEVKRNDASSRCRCDNSWWLLGAANGRGARISNWTSKMSAADVVRPPGRPSRF